MKLFRYEMKKLLLNKNKLILLSAMFIIYVLIGYFLSMTEGPTPTQDTLNEHSRLVSEAEGAINPELLAKSQAAREAAIEKYGAIGYNEKLHHDPILRFHARYIAFGQRVNEYWNGPDSQDISDIQGIYPIQENLRELEATGDKNSYEYRYYEKRLETEMSLGEPLFVNANFWNSYFLLFDTLILVFLLLMALPFFISPLFTQEVKTGMDSIVLCSEKGRCEIVTAKLVATVLTSAVIAIVYLAGFSIGTLIGHRNINGFNAPAHYLEVLQGTQLDMSAFGAAVFGAAWLILATVVFGVALALISTQTKNQSSAMGLGMVILVGGVLSGSLGAAAREFLWPVMDFNFGALALFLSIFGGHYNYNVFGWPVSYGVIAFVICILLGVVAALLAYWAQKKRSAI